MSMIRRVVGQRMPTAVLIMSALLLTSAAQAGSVPIMGDGYNSTEGLGAFTGVVDYQCDMFSTFGLLTIELTNTSDPGNGGYKFPVEPIGQRSHVSDDGPFRDLRSGFGS